MAEIEKKAPMVLGIGAALAGVLLLFRKKKPPLPEAPPSSVVVGLLNPPNGANKWQMTVVDDPLMRAVSWGLDDHDNIDEAAVFELPDWLFPAPVSISVYQEWQEDNEWHAKQLYYIQSLHPYLWDFDKRAWGYEEDPTYREVFIPDYGGYYYDVSKERFE